MTLLRGLAVLLLCGLASRAAEAPAPSAKPAPAAASPWPGQWLADAFGPKALEALQRHGVVVLQGKAGSYRLQAVSWRSLGALARSTKAVQQFSDAFPRLRAGQALAPAGPLPFLALADLAPESLFTPPLRALLAVMEAYHHEWAELAGPQDEAAPAAALPAAPSPELFETSWGKAFAARTRADVVSDPAPLAQAFFDSFLAGVRPEPQAAAHLGSYLKNRYQVDASTRLAADARAGTLSAGLREDLSRYLVEQRRFHSLARLRQEVLDLEKKTDLDRDLEDLAAAAAVLRGRPGLVTDLEGVVSAAPPAAAAPELTSAGLHLGKPAALGQHELGDAITLSGAYWVDGLPGQQTMEVEETTFRQSPDGFSDQETHAVKRGNGGPYPFARRLVLEDSSTFTFRSAISAPSGNSLSDSIPVPVAKDFELALLKLAAADGRRLSCALPEALDAYAKLEQTLAEPAGEKAQYRELLQVVRERRQGASKDAGTLAKLQAAAKEAAADLSPEACRYEPKRTQAALGLASSLPAGCDQTLAELRRGLAVLQRRQADQQAFAADLRQAAAHRRACAFASAAEDLTRGLAILAADPEARCGATAVGALQAEADLKAARAGELWTQALDEELDAAQGETAPVRRLARVEPVLARIGWLEDPSCFASERGLAEKWAKSAGEALAAPDSIALAADEGLSAAVAEVAAQRRKLLSQAAALETKQAAEQAPAPARRAPKRKTAPQAQPGANPADLPGVESVPGSQGKP